MRLTFIDTKATGQNIKHLFKESGLSMEEFAEAMGLTGPRTIFKWFSGDAVPKTDNLITMKFLFNTSIDEILVGIDEGDDHPSPSNFFGYLLAS